MDGQTRDAAEPQSHGVTCDRCGAVADEPPLTWTCSVENGTRRYVCDRCARGNLRAIESRLDSSWW